MNAHRLYVRVALLCLFGALLTGGGSLAFYVPIAGATLAAWGLPFEALRPLHIDLGMAWVFLGGLSAMLPAGETRPEARKALLLWLIFGGAALAASAFGLRSGREYLSFHPIFAPALLLGWLVFMRGWAKNEGFRFLDTPAYSAMRSSSLFLFVIVFLEAHAYLLPWIGNSPLRDIALQWKAYGAFFGSFNLLVYAALMELNEEITGDRSYARSNLAYSLFIVGIVNSFTNFAHHSYHLPQARMVKLVSFAVSMAEIVIVAKLFWDLAGLKRSQEAWKSRPLAALFLSYAALWSFLQTGFAVLLSIPPLNSLLHGTHAIAAHAMGSMIGIDTMVLLAVLGNALYRETPPSRPLKTLVHLFNASFAVFWLSLLVYGAAKGAALYSGTQNAVPAALFSSVFAASGLALLLSLGGTALFLWNRSLGPVSNRHENS